MAFRPLPLFATYFKNDGTLNAGGAIRFYEVGTEDAKSVYGDIDLNDDLGNEVAIGVNGRVAGEVWGDGAYRVVLVDEDDNTLDDQDNVQSEAGAALSLPDPADLPGGTLVSDGAAYVLEDQSARLLPDMAGHADEHLVTDGDVASWAAMPEATTYDEDNLPGGIDATAGSAWYIDIGSIRVQGGSGTADANPSLFTSKAVTYPAAFDGLAWSINVTPGGQGVTNNSPPDNPSASYGGVVEGGFTAYFYAGGENNGGTLVIEDAIPFSWVAIGLKP